MPIEISDASGIYADIVNGTYTSTEERINSKTVYTKLGDDSLCLYFAADKFWWVALMSEAKAGNVTGFAFTEAGLPHPSMAKQWRLAGDSDSWQPQALVASVTASFFLQVYIEILQAQKKIIYLYILMESS